MAKLHFRISPSFSKSKNKHASTDSSPSTSVASVPTGSMQIREEKHVGYGSNTNKSGSGSEIEGLPKVPYIKCGFRSVPAKVGPVERLCNSPVNHKARDITFPSSPAIQDVGSLFSFEESDCSPKEGKIKQEEDEIDYKIAAIHPRRYWLSMGCDPCRFLDSANDLREDCKLRFSRSSSTVVPAVSMASQACSWEKQSTWSTIASIDNQIVRKQVVLKKKKKIKQKNADQYAQNVDESAKDVSKNDRGEVLESNKKNATSSTPSSNSYYKLSTSSPESLEIEWDKDFCSFASESSLFTASSPLVSSRKNGSNGFFQQKSSKEGKISSSQIKHGGDHVPFILHRNNFDDPEAASRSWTRPNTAFSSSKDCNSSPDVFLDCQEDPSAADCSRISDPKSKEGLYEAESSSCSDNQNQIASTNRPKRLRRRTRKVRHEAPGYGGISRVRESVAVVKSSFDPYKDFRDSMIEMILKKELFEEGDLQELLRSYLFLNSTESHDVIVQAFTDIWYQMFDADPICITSGFGECSEG